MAVRQVVRLSRLGVDVDAELTLLHHLDDPRPPYPGGGRQGTPSRSRLMDRTHAADALQHRLAPNP